MQSLRFKCDARERSRAKPWWGLFDDGLRVLHTIAVKRINIIEPDGTLRMVQSNKAQFPGVIVKAEEHKQDRPFAGMLFFNDEGTENGGLIFNGSKDGGGKGREWREPDV